MYLSITVSLTLLVDSNASYSRVEEQRIHGFFLHCVSLFYMYHNLWSYIFLQYVGKPQIKYVFVKMWLLICNKSFLNGTWQFFLQLWLALSFKHSLLVCPLLKCDQSKSPEAVFIVKLMSYRICFNSILYRIKQKYV